MMIVHQCLCILFVGVISDVLIQDKRILFTTEDSGAMEGGCLFDGMVPAQAFLVVER